MKKALIVLIFMMASMSIYAQVIYKYDKVYNFSEGLAVVSLNDKYGFINLSGEVVVPLEYDYVVDCSDGLAAVFQKESQARENGYNYYSVGFVDKTGKLVIPLKYSTVSLPFGESFVFKDGFAAVSWGTTGLTKGYIDKKGKEVYTYKSAESFFEGLAVVGNDDDKNGVINKKGKLVVPFRYDYIGYFEDGFADVESGGKTGLINSEGKEIIPTQYDFAYALSKDLIVVERGKEKALFDKNGKIIASWATYEDFGSSTSSGLFGAKKNGKWGYLDKSGNEKIPFQFDDCGVFSEELAPVNINGKWGYIDKSGNKVIDGSFEEAFAFSEGLAKVKQQGKYGFIDKSGQIVIPAKYDKANFFKEGLAAVCRFEKWGFIDKTGKPLEIKE